MLQVEETQSCSTASALLKAPGSQDFRISESAGYIDSGEEQIYYVLHESPEPVAIALLAGPFPSERPFSYAPWVRWARFLARNGITSLHFDYRGAGESTGRLQEMSFASWSNDLEVCMRLLRGSAPQVPLLMCSLGMGGLLASELFRRGVGEVLLLWSPPSGGEQALRDILVRRVSFDYALRRPGGPKTLGDYVKVLEAGGSINVEGYTITGRLFLESKSLRLGCEELDQCVVESGSRRCWKTVRLTAAENPLISGTSLWRALNPRAPIGRYPLNPDLGKFFAENARWLMESLQRRWP